MTSRFFLPFACLVAGSGLFCGNTSLRAQTSVERPAAVLIADTELPDAPLPQQTQNPSSTQPQSSQSPASGQQPASSSGSSASSGSQATSPDATKPSTGSTTQKSAHDLAQEQIKEQEKQRVLGIVPNFNTSYVYGAASLTSAQKFDLAIKTEIDPVSFGVAGFVALLGQAEGSDYGYGGGIGGYAKRYGQTYADNFDGEMWGNWILPSLLHQDPRYFRLGRGSIKRRILYALGTNVICRHDNTGKWEPNYSNVGGNFISGAISNLYLPQDERGISSTVTGALVITAEGGAGSLFQEFWPDISRHFLHKDPTHGQDAINRSQPDPTGGGNPFSNHPHRQMQQAEPGQPKQDQPDQR